MSTPPEVGAHDYDVRAARPPMKPRAAAYVVRAHCLRKGCPGHWEGDDADRQSRLHTEKAKHPTACRTELTSAPQGP